MKTRLFLMALLLVCVLPLSSFRSEKRITMPVKMALLLNRKALSANSPYRQTEFEYGDFEYGGQWYAIYGNSLGNITHIYILNGGTGPAVHQFHGTATPVNAPNPGSANVYFTPGSIEYHYSGVLWYI